MTIAKIKSAKLVADIGGTNARFALVLDGAYKPLHEQVLSCADFDGPVAAIRHYLKHCAGQIGEVSLNAAALAIAGPACRWR